jgi:hypothetical protein
MRYREKWLKRYSASKNTSDEASVLKDNKQIQRKEPKAPKKAKRTPLIKDKDENDFLGDGELDLLLNYTGFYFSFIPFLLLIFYSKDLANAEFDNNGVKKNYSLC